MMLGPAEAGAGIRRAWAIFVLLGGLAGCGHSPPTRYFTLSAEPAVAPQMATRLQPVQLTAVHIPAELDRPEVVTQSAANQLTVHETDRWGAPLGQMMRRTLAQDLLARLPAQSFILPDAPAPPSTRTLVVTVLSIQTDAQGSLGMQVAWTLMAGQPSRQILTQETTLSSKTAGREAAGQAEAMSQMLGQLADRMAASLVAR